MATVVAPAVVTNKAGSDRAVCRNNLRLIGRAIHSFAADHDNRTPWRTPVSEGGTSVNPRPGNAWSEYLVFTNELRSPSVFGCPADEGVLTADTWDIFHTTRQNAVSYSIWPDAILEMSRSIASADMNTRFEAGTAGCSAGFTGLNYVRTTNTSLFAWTNGVHQYAGHALLSDGSVEFTDTPTLRTLPTAVSSTTGPAHVVKAR